MKKLSTYLALLLLVLAASPAFAQRLTGTITGTVKDQQGGVLPGATVTLTGKTGAVTATTDPAGVYRFPAVDPGTYEVKAELAGFQARREENLLVRSGEQIMVDFSLKVAGLGETIEVVEESPLVDVTSSATTNTISQELLYYLPLTRNNPAANLINAAPGINNSSAYGGGAGTANALLLDGVDTRDPEGGTPWTFWNYNIMEEVHIQGLGAPAEYGGYTGAIINTLSKSGGNSFRGLFDVNYTRGSFATSNVKDEHIRQNPALKEAAKTKKLIDFTTQISGPIVKDKLFFFASVQRYAFDVDPAGPSTFRNEVSPRFNAKLTFQPDPNDNFMGHFQADDYNIRGRAGVSALLATDDLTNEEDAPEYVWNVQWRHLFGSNTFTEFKYLGWWGYFDLNPDERHRVPGHYDGATGQYSVSQGWFAGYDRYRHQVNASITHYAEAFGKHDLKFGVEIERSKTRNQSGYFNDIWYYDYGGAPYLAYEYSYDVQGINQRESFYVQDAWKPTGRLTINAGVRLDRISGKDPDKKVFETTSIGPRLGFALDLTGDQRTVLRGSYGQYYEAAFSTLYNRGVPGIGDYVTFDVSACPAIGANCKRFAVEIDRVPALIYKVDPDLKHPRVDEFTAGIERALTSDLRVRVIGIYRENKNIVDSVFPDARWTPVTVTNRLTNTPITVYRWANRTASQENALITNVDGFQYRDPSGNVLGTARAFRKYKALMVVLTKRLKNRWGGQASYVLSNAEGTLDNDFAGSTGASRRYESATMALVNVEGDVINDRRHEVKAGVFYDIPVIDLRASVFYTRLSGRPYTPFQRLTSSSINFPQSSAGRNLLLEPRGNRRRETQNTMLLRVEKFFKVGKDRKDELSVYADVNNLLNDDTITFVQDRVPNVSIAGVPTPIEFGSPLAIAPARQVTFGARWSF